MDTKSAPRFGTLNFEKRRHPRYSVNLPVEYRPTPDHPPGRPGRTGNVSEGGLLLYVSEEMEIGQSLRLRVFLAPEKRNIVEAEVQVVWKDFRIGKEGFYRIWVNITDISAAEMEKLRGFVNHFMNDAPPTDLQVPPKLLASLGISTVRQFAWVMTGATRIDAAGSNRKLK